ncbi:hypothetical protein CLOM_g15531 [Closterium sp. NIES-68]|nr:hypothetical protein CLOM_g15531 [Closterium sp. NIES-68]
MASDIPFKSQVHHGRTGAQQELTFGAERMVSLLVGPDRTPFLCSASLLSRHSPFLASLLSDRWTAAAAHSSEDGAEAVAREESGERGGSAAVDTFELMSVDAGDFAQVMLILAYKQLQSQPDLAIEELESLRSTLDFLKVDVDSHNAHVGRDLHSNDKKGSNSPCSSTATTSCVSLTSFSCPPLVRQLRPVPIVRVPPGCEDPLLFEQPDEFSKFRLNLRHHAILCTICWASGQGLRSGHICGHGHLWALVDRTQRKVVQPDLCTTRLCLYSKLRNMYDDQRSGSVQIRQELSIQSLVLPITLPAGGSLHCPQCRSLRCLVYLFRTSAWCADCGWKWVPQTIPDMSSFFHTAVEQAKELLEECIRLYSWQ